MYKKFRNSWMKHLDFMIVDIICLEISFVLGFMIRHGLRSPFDVPIYQRISIILILVDLCVSFFNESYRGVIRRGYAKEMKGVMQHSTIILAVTITYMFLTRQSLLYSRSVLIDTWMISMVFMYGGRMLLKEYLKNRSIDRSKMRSLLLVTTKQELEQSLTTLLEHQFNKYYVSGIVVTDDNMRGQMVKGVPVVADKEDMMEMKYAKTHVIDEIFLQISGQDELIEEFTNTFLQMGITVHVSLIRNIKSSMENRVVESFGGYSVVSASMKMATPRQLFMKRCMDIFGGSIGCIVTGIVFLFLAPIIYIQSPGPILFKQDRVGKNGRKFKIYKFRSMYIDAEERKKELMSQNKMNGLMFKIDDDPRIMPIGKFIRNLSIDELPQSFNILMGSMSLVGTRPPTVDEYEQYELRHKSRLATKPGLTGMWQVSGRSDITDFEEVVRLDTDYIRNWNLSMDLRILAKTVGVVLGRKGSV